jgi:hypothetical protein
MLLNKGLNNETQHTYSNSRRRTDRYAQAVQDAMWQATNRPVDAK